MQALVLSPDGPPPLLRPARSFYNNLRLLELRQCMMNVLELQLLELRCPAVQRGAVHIQTSIYEPSYRSRHSKRKTESRGYARVRVVMGCQRPLPRARLPGRS